MTTMPLAFLADEVERNRNDYYIGRRRPETQNEPRPYRTMAIMVDFQKAFDSISHRRLMKQISALSETSNSGASGNEGNGEAVRLRNWIRSFLINRHHRVKVSSDMSKARKLYRGVPQGSVLGPFLFIMYVDPLLKALNSLSEVKATMFADDLTIILKVKNKEEAITKGDAILRLIEEWGKDNELFVNPDKCEALWFTLSSKTEDDKQQDSLTIAGSTIPIATMGSGNHVPAPKLLGVKLDTRLRFTEAAKMATASTGTRIAQLNCIANYQAGPRPHEQRQFAIGYGMSKLVYATDVSWGALPETSKIRMDRAYNNLARNVCSLPSTTDSDSALLEANMLPLHFTTIIKRAALFEKLWALGYSWTTRPPPEPPPGTRYRPQPIAALDWSQQLTTFLRE
ncbi:hypothetical protein STCU_00848, partial [Strigomonas culicis]